MSESQKNEFTKLALKLAGIYILVQAIQYFTPVVASLKAFTLTNEMNLVSFSLLLTFVLLVTLGLWLIFGNKVKFEKGSAVSKELLRTGLVVSGVIIFAFAIGDLPLLISKFLFSLDSYKPMETLIGWKNSFENGMALLGNLIQLSLGACLFFKAKHFSQLLK